MALGYCYMGVLTIPTPDWTTVALHLLCMVLVFLCSGLFVRYFTDLCDIEQDRLAGKENLATADSTIIRLAKLIGYSLGIPALLWVFSMPLLLYVLMGVQHILYLIYSLPPVRLKERQFPGALCDALYGHVVPAMVGFAFGAATAEISTNQVYFYLIIVGFSQIILGINNIIYHQIDDYHKDNKAGVKTWVSVTGTFRSFKLGKRWLLPLSILLLIGYYVLWGWEIHPVLTAGLVALLLFISLPLFRGNWQERFSKEENVLIYPNELTEIWAPIMALMTLVYVDWKFSLLAAIHIIGFRSIILPRAKYYSVLFTDGIRWFQGELVHFYYHKVLTFYAALKKRINR